MPYVSAASGAYLGMVIDDGECVAYVQLECGAPHTSAWRAGAPVRDSGACKGTAIATFDPDGTYGNHADGSSHAAMLVEVTDAGLVVTDQWQGQPVHERLIQFKNGAEPACDDGDAYAVIEPAVALV